MISSHRRRRPGEEREINWPSRCQFRCYLDWQNHAELGCVRHPEFLHLAEMACLGVCRPLMTLSSEWPKRPRQNVSLVTLTRRSRICLQHVPKMIARRLAKEDFGNDGPIVCLAGAVGFPTCFSEASGIRA